MKMQTEAARLEALVIALREALPLIERAATEEARGNRAPTGQPPRTARREQWERATALLTS